MKYLKKSWNEKYCMSDSRVKVTGKPSKYYSLTLLLSRLCEDHHYEWNKNEVRNTGVNSPGKPF